jgi:hypothetical protein
MVINAMQCNQASTHNQDEEIFENGCEEPL